MGGRGCHLSPPEIRRTVVVKSLSTLIMGMNIMVDLGV